MLTKILNLAESNGFIHYYIKDKRKFIKLGTNGVLLKKNLEQQWFNNVVMNKDISMLPCEYSLESTFNFAKKICLEKLPFGIVERIQPPCNIEFKESNLKKQKSDKISFEDLFEEKDKLLLKTTIFVPSESATHYFHQWQKQRRIWWRKFSAMPGKYSLTDIKIDNAQKQSVNIIAEYQWGPQLLESICLTKKGEFSADKLQFKDGKKHVQGYVLTAEVILPVMFLNGIFDSYDEPIFKEDRRQLLRLHRKLAPYSISFSVTGSSAAKVSELSDLAVYLTKQLRAADISTLLLPSSSKYTLETQFKQYDQLGVPYTVLLNDKTLVDGILQLRSRDTTLKEQVHVTLLVSYVEKLFKNY